MNPGRTWMLGLALVAALLATASSASAKPGYSVFAGYRSIGFSLEGSNGFGIRVEKWGHRVFLLATDEQSTVAYVPRASVPKGDAIKFRLPGVGRVSVRFRPQGPPSRSPDKSFPRCRGGESFKQSGHFVGTIRFRGERGYTSVRAKRVKGAIEGRTKEVCKRSPSEDDDFEPLVDRTELWVKAGSGRSGVGFSAFMHSDPVDLPIFSASVTERRRGMTIFRNTFAEGKRGGLAIGDTRPYPLSATVTPPAPFSGSAEYERTPDGKRTWTGTLTVPLPGLGRVTLTGPAFSPRLCQSSGCSGNSIDGHRLPWQSSLHDRLRLP